MSDGPLDGGPAPPGTRPGGDPAPPPWAPTPEQDAFTRRLLRLRRHDGLGRRLERARHAGEAFDRFAAGRELSTTVSGRVGVRYACPARAQLPDAVEQGLKACQKPFHLWNVERIEDDEPFKLTKQDALKLGAAAKAVGPLGIPRNLEKATKALAKFIEEDAFRDALVRMDRKRFRERLLVDTLPFGKPDDHAPEPQGMVIPVGARLPANLEAFVRRPGPPAGLALGQPDEEDEPSPRRAPPPPPPPRRGPPASPRPGPAGFDLSQPDDGGGGAGPPGFGGFDLSQPD